MVIRSLYDDVDEVVEVVVDCFEVGVFKVSSVGWSSFPVVKGLWVLRVCLYGCVSYYNRCRGRYL
jgi:hypothetical protein